MIVPFLLSVFIALICSPPLVWLKARGVPGALAIVVIVVVIVLLGFGVGAVVGTSINDFRQDIPFYRQRLLEMTAGAVAWLGQLGIDIDLEQLRTGFDPGAVMQIAGNTLASLGNLMTNAFMILLTVIFILAEEVGFGEKLAMARNHRGDMTRELKRFSASVNRYLGLKTLMSLLTGGIIMVWLQVLGVDYAVMWGLLAFLLNFVPTVGSILAAIPAVLLALVQLGPLMAGLTALGFAFTNVGIGSVLEPRLMGRGLNLSPLVVFLSLVFWGWILGPVGMLLSIPLTIMVKIALESDPKTRWIGIMLGGGPPGDYSLIETPEEAGGSLEGPN